MSDLDMRPTAAGDLAALDELGRIPFGSRSNQTMPPSWASAMLTMMRQDEVDGKKPRPFSAYLAAVAVYGTDGNL